VSQFVCLFSVDENDVELHCVEEKYICYGINITKKRIEIHTSTGTHRYFLDAGDSVQLQLHGR